MKVAALQMNSLDDKKSNLSIVGKLIDQAVERGAQLVALPEYFTVYGNMPEVLGAAEPIPGPSTAFLQEKAVEHGIYIHGGTISEVIEGNDKCAFTSLFVGPSGSILGKYRKIHLFDIDLEERASGNESDIAVPGEDIVAVETPETTFGLTVCYDLRFPELYRVLTLNGARVIFVPAAFTMYTGKDHWEVLLRARAIENQVYIVAAAQYGRHAPDKYTFGATMIIDPWGTVIAKAPENDSVIVADLDFEYQDSIRRKLPSLRNRKPEVYKSLG